MSRDYGAPFDFMESEPVGRAIDCLGSRQTAGPFHYLINEQAKSLLALQELQHEVGALLEFRDLVIETFPSLRTKLSSTSSPAASAVGTALVRADWVPGVRVRRKLAPKKADAVPDSGFSTETSSKDTHSASSTAMAPASDDELWNLLDVIHRKGTRLKDEVETLQGQLQQRVSSDDDFHESLYRASPEEMRVIRLERDSLKGRLAEMEAEVVASRLHTSRLQEDLEQLIAAKQDLEEQLQSLLSQRGEVNSRIHDLHSQFVSKGNKRSASNKEPASSQKESRTNDCGGDGVGLCETYDSASLDKVLGDELPKVSVTDTKKFTAILAERNPLVLQKHLLTTTVQNEVLLRQLENATQLEVNLVDKLDRVREENEELKFQLEDRNIELEGTRARIRMLEQLQRAPCHSSPDVIPTSTLSSSPPSRGEILTNSMKQMSPIAILDNSSSTESAHDQTENNRKNSDSARRRPSKIPLKSYTAPKPPGRGKSQSSSSHGARSRSGESPSRPHSAQSGRGSGAKSAEAANSLQSPASKGGGSQPRSSRNGSLVTTKDSLSSKLRGSDSLSSRMSASGGGGSSFGAGGTGAAPARKNSSSPVVRWTGSGKDQPTTDKDNSSPVNRDKSRYRWSPYSFDAEDGGGGDDYPDSLDRNNSDSSASRKFQTANNFTWNAGGGKLKEYYDSIDSNLFSSLYQPNGEQLAECDSLEIHISSMSF